MEWETICFNFNCSPLFHPGHKHVIVHALPPPLIFRTISNTVGPILYSWV